MIGKQSKIYRRWVVANGWAEAAGLGTTFVAGVGVAPLIESEPGPALILAGALIAVLLGTLLEGVVVGFAQGRVLHATRPGFSVRTWILATAIGAGLAWLIGLVPSTTMSLLSAGDPSPAIEEPPALIQYLLAASLGLVAGPILGIAQWIVLRRLFSGAASWLLANALAWAVGMPAIFVGMDFVPWGGPPLLRAATIYAVCFVTGLVVGAIHGWFLVRLLDRPTPLDEGKR